MTRLLIGSWLKGRAADWLHARDEHVDMPVDSLEKYVCLKSKYSYAKNQFEDIWRRGEIFRDYMIRKFWRVAFESRVQN